MAITKDEFKRRVKGDATSPSMLTDLDVSVIDSVFRGFDVSDATNISKDDAFVEIIYKIVELFEASIYPDSSLSDTIINDVVAALDQPNRLAGKGGDVRRELEAAKTRLADIITKLDDLKTKYNDETFIRDLVSDVASITNKEVRKSLWERILTESNKEVFSVADDKAQARVAGEELWSRLNTEMASARVGDDLTSIVRDSDYLDSIETAWTNVQSGDTGAYRKLNETIAQLESDLGGLVTDTLLDNDDKRINAIYEAASGPELISLARDVNDFLEVASEDEMKEVRDALNDALGIPNAATASAAITANPTHSNSFRTAVTEIERVLAAGSVRTAGIDAASIDASINDPATGLQKLYNDAVAAFDAADQAFKEAEFKNNNFSKGLTELEIQAGMSTGWEKALLEAEIDYRKNDPAATHQSKIKTDDLEHSLTAMGLTRTFSISDERAARSWLADYICNKDLGDLVTTIGTDELKDTFKNEIMAKFGPSANSVISVVENEVFSRNAAVRSGQWYAKYGNDALENMKVSKKQPDDGMGNPYPNHGITPVEFVAIEDTIRARKGLCSGWFAVGNGNGLLSDDKLDLVERILNELKRRDTFRQTRDTAESARDAAESARNVADTNLKAAQNKLASRNCYTRFKTCKNSRDSDLADNVTKRPKITELKVAKDIKGVYDALLADAVRDLATQQNIDDTAIKNYLTAHRRISELRSSSYSEKRELEDQLVSEISRRLNKTRSAAPVVNHGSSTKKWYQGIVDWVEKTAGAALGAAATCLTNSPAILIGGAVASVGYIALEGYNLYISSKLKKEGALPDTEPKPVTAMLAANNTLRAKAVNWYRNLKAKHRHISNVLDGVPFGFLAGFGVKKITGKNIWEHMSGNGTSEPPLQPEGVVNMENVANVITKDSVNNLGNLPYACEGPGLPDEKILPGQRKYWQNVQFVRSIFDPTRGEPLLLFRDPTKVDCVGCASRSALESIGFTFDEEMLAAMGDVVTRAATRC